MADVVNDQDLPVNVSQAGRGEEKAVEGERPRLRLPDRPTLVVLLLWAVQFAAFSIDRMIRYPELEGFDTLSARLIVTAAGAFLSLAILSALRKSAGRSFLVRALIAFFLALVAAAIHSLVNVFAFLLILGPTGAEPLSQDLALSLPPLIFFFSWVHLAIAVVLLSLTYGQEVVQKERRLVEVSTQLESLKQIRPEDDQPHLWVRDGPRKVRVNIADIEWIGAEGEYVRLHSGDRSWLERRSMAELERQLAPFGLVRVHRSAIVPSQRIESLGRTPSGSLYVDLDTGRRVRVGKAFQQSVRDLVDRTSGKLSERDVE